MGINRKGAEFIRTKQTDSRTHRHTDTELYRTKLWSLDPDVANSHFPTVSTM